MAREHPGPPASRQPSPSRPDGTAPRARILEHIAAAVVGVGQEGARRVGRLGAVVLILRADDVVAEVDPLVRVVGAHLRHLARGSDGDGVSVLN